MEATATCCHWRSHNGGGCSHSMERGQDGNWMTTGSGQNGITELLSFYAPSCPLQRCTSAAVTSLTAAQGCASARPGCVMATMTAGTGRMKLCAPVSTHHAECHGFENSLGPWAVPGGASVELRVRGYQGTRFLHPDYPPPKQGPWKPFYSCSLDCLRNATWIHG